MNMYTHQKHLGEYPPGLIEKLEKIWGKVDNPLHLCVDVETNKIISDINTIRDNQTITIIPVVAGGFQ
jgi:molybdopterin converting factor small subunit